MLQTDGRTACNRNTALCNSSSRGKNAPTNSRMREVVGVMRGCAKIVGVRRVREKKLFHWVSIIVVILFAHPVNCAYVSDACRPSANTTQTPLQGYTADCVTLVLLGRMTWKRHDALRDIAGTKIVQVSGCLKSVSAYRVGRKISLLIFAITLSTANQFS